MARIVVKVWSAVSHYNATFALAKSLREHGHEVIYAGVEELRSYVEPQGFTFLVHEEKGLFNPFLGRPGTAPASVWPLLRSLATWRRGRAGTRNPDLASVAFLKLAQEIEPAAILLDAHYTVLALHLLKRGMRFAVLSTKVCLDRFPGLPPIHSPLVPDGSTLSRVRADLAWRWYFAQRACRTVVRCSSRYTVRQMARHADRAESDFETERALFTGIKCVPEFLLSPREFDFPHRTKSHQRYVSGDPDLDRSDPHHDVAFRFRFDPLRRARASGRPLVYCCLGTISWRYRGVAGFLARLVQAADGQPWNLLVATGCVTTPRSLPPLPANVAVLQRVPQVEVLRSSDVMVTHGGMNSIKECIALGVPMLVYPGAADIDQEGNSARVLYHGLGLRGRMAGDSAAEIRSKINRLLGDSRFHHNVADLAARIQRSDAHLRSAEIVEQSLSLPSSHVYHASR